MLLFRWVLLRWTEAQGLVSRRKRGAERRALNAYPFLFLELYH